MDTKKMIIFGILAAAILAAGYFIWQMIEDRMSCDLYVNEKEGVSMRYPKGWKVVEHPEGGAVVVMVKPKENALTIFQDNWNISMTPLAKPLTLDEYVKAANAQVKFMFSQTKETTYLVFLSGHQGRKLVWLSPAEDGLVLITYVFIYKDVAYNITFMGLKDNYLNPKKSKMIDRVIRSLKVKF